VTCAHKGRTNMPATIYYDDDADPPLLDGRKVAVLGYGSQGHAHALNLKESGVDVRVGLRDGSSSWAKAEAAGLVVTTIAQAGKAKQTALAYARAIGANRAGVLDTTCEEETETDLFGEQVVLCGGLTELIKGSYETLVAAGYQPESAYFETLHEVKLIVDLIYEGGITNMRYSISDTAEYGDMTRGPRIITDETRAEMRRILDDIQTGRFANEWILENQAGRPVFNALRRQSAEHPIEEVGERLRAMMPWIGAGKTRPQDASGG